MPMKTYLSMAALPLCLLALGCSPRGDTGSKTAQAAHDATPVASASSAHDDVEPPQARFIDDLSFSDYPIEVYKGPILKPTFTGAQKTYYDYRTRIRQSVAAGPMFAGSMTIIFFGCGASCTTGFMYDLKTGVFHELPIAGEEYPEANIDYRSDSRLLVTEWRGGEDWDHPTCVRAFHEWTGDGFKELQRREVAGQCPDMWQSNASSEASSSVDLQR